MGTSPFVSPKFVSVWYLGVPSSAKAPMLKMNGPTPLAASGKPASDDADVVTGHDAMPTAPRNVLACGAAILTVDFDAVGRGDGRR